MKTNYEYRMRPPRTYSATAKIPTNCHAIEFKCFPPEVPDDQATVSIYIGDGEINIPQGEIFGFAAPTADGIILQEIELAIGSGCTVQVRWLDALPIPDRFQSPHDR